jgi:uncharacterized RDD family membrane protein YckC
MTTESRDWHPSPDAPTTPLRDQLSIATPELVAIEFPLAGIGSRFIAILLDYFLQWVTVVILLLLTVLMFSGSSHTAAGGTARAAASKWAMAVVISIPFLLEWAYFALFEAFWRGQTPGKRIMHIRVIQQTGRPIGLFESLGRNLVRFVDMLPGIYIVGIISMFCTRRQQRLGDLVAGTLVVHDRKLETPLENIGASRTFTFSSFQAATASVPPPRESKLPADAVARLTLADLQALESYLARRLDVPMETRSLLATRLADNVSLKMNLPIPDGMSQETFLEEAAFALRGMQHLQR